MVFSSIIFIFVTFYTAYGKQLASERDILTEAYRYGDGIFLYADFCMHKTSVGST